MLAKVTRDKVKTAEPNRRVLRLTLQNMLAEGTEIWVRNRTAKLTEKNSGLLVLQVGSGNMVDSVIIPPGNDPVCLTDQVTPKLLAECMDLFKMVKSGALQLLDPANATEYYKKNRERKKIVQDKITRLTKQTIMPGPAPSVAPKAVSSSTVEVNQQIGDICLKSKHGAISEQEALERLFEQEEVLKMDDYNYLVSNGVYTGIKRWAKDQIKKLAVAEEEQVEEDDADDDE